MLQLKHRYKKEDERKVVPFWYKIQSGGKQGELRRSIEKLSTT